MHTRVASLLLAAAVVAMCCKAAAAAPAIAIVHATLVHPELEGAAASVPDSTLVIVGERISAVGPAAATRVPRGARLIDGHGKWVIPGLIDSHVHFFQSGTLYTRPDVADLTRWVPYAAEVQRTRASLAATFRIWLASGVTGVADVGGPFSNFEVRELARASPAAPRVATTGPLISTVARPQLDLGDPPIIEVTSAEEARALVARELPYHPDYIKVWFIHRPEDDIAVQEPIVRAAAEAAHAAGLRLAVHATELVTAKAALRAGADLLVHSVRDLPVDDEFLALARTRQILYCPTLFVGPGYFLALSGAWQATPEEERLAGRETLERMHLPAGVPEEQLPEPLRKLRAGPHEVQWPQVAMQNLITVWNAGITVVMGTDAGNIGTLHGPGVFRELALMQRAGLSPLQVLRSATVNGARTLAMPDLGVIAPGKLADLVVLDADPLADVANLSHATLVFKGGREFSPAALVKSLQ